MFKPVTTPCVGICSTGIGDAVCRGCKRFAHEVIDWNAYSHEQQWAIEQRLAGFLAQVVAQHVEVLDAARLRQQLALQRVRYRADRPALCWVFDLLRAGASQIGDVSRYGLRLIGPQRDLVALKHTIDADYYLLSQAHYERYIAPGEKESTVDS